MWKPCQGLVTGFTVTQQDDRARPLAAGREAVLVCALGVSKRYLFFYGRRNNAVASKALLSPKACPQHSGDSLPPDGDVWVSEGAMP